MLFGFISSETSYCCEKTTSGAWCLNSPETQCDSTYKKAPTSCESTSYCRLGTCIDSEEGTCLENTPQRICEADNGIWYDKESNSISQCTLGCCLLGDQAAFVTQTRCKRISALYGLETNFRLDISNEATCIASITSEVKGACVFEKELEKTCSFITKKQCSEISGNTSFHEEYLCSDETLGTNCGPSLKTTCVDGKDEVYFLDTCGNIANVYDASKINNKEYWTKVKDVSESCGYGSSNANSATCGNCDYYLGSTCKAYDKSEDKSKPNYGDNICRDLSCKYEGKIYQHGETWCADNEGSKDNLPGSRYFRLVCYNGDVTVEPCDDFRQGICIESDIAGFKTAACRVNKWQDCSAQGNSKDCENSDRRDCNWLGSKCVPKYPPGFEFWENSDAESICSTASTQCTVIFEKKLIGEKTCVENCECLDSSWQIKQNQMCVSLGDCGSKTNYLGYSGYHDGDAVYSGTSSGSAGNSS